MTFPYLIATILVAAGLYLLARWVADADPKLLARHLRTAALVLTAAIALSLYVTGRLALVVLLAALLLPILLQWKSIAARLKSGGRPSPGQASSISTAFLDVRLDHDSGEMQGTVKRGAFEGRDLAGMTLEDLMVLHGECQGQDAQSIAILDAYLDRRFGTGWRSDEDRARSAQRNFRDGPMTAEEAYRILGLEAGASPTEIKDAHRRMMKNFHPDHGGSDYIAAKLNEAKSILLGD